MNRRAFLALFGVTAATLAADPEALLWTPGKTISVPAGLGPDGVFHWRFDEFLTPNVITRDALAILRERFMFAKIVNLSFEDSRKLYGFQAPPRDFFNRALGVVVCRTGGARRNA
ncbi:MAG: hypothetical protein NVSMB64_20000 [Candidatus Velthaea sp.]